MISIDAEIYREFTCKADKCKHTCCRGWEIDIDDDTLDYYNGLDTELGNEIRKNISGCGQEGESASFMLTTDERCPFLKDDGLCRIIEELGDDGLCDICRLHPRFYESINDYNLAGVGLSCEKASELLFGKKSLDFIICDSVDSSGDGSGYDSCDGSESGTGSGDSGGRRIGFTKLLELLEIDYPEEYLDISNVLSDYLSESRIEKILDVFYNTEPIDDNWKKEVSLLKESYKDYLCHLSGKDEESAKKDIAIRDIDIKRYEVIYRYIIFRQLDQIEVYGMKMLYEYAASSIIYIMLYAAAIRDDIEAVRRWSEQIEYDDDNINYIIKNL